MQTKAKSIREQSKAEIEKAIQEKRGELYRIRFEATTQEKKNYRAGGVIRKEIARLLTVLSEKEFEGNL